MSPVIYQVDGPSKRVGRVRRLGVVLLVAVYVAACTGLARLVIDDDVHIVNVVLVGIVLALLISAVPLGLTALVYWIWHGEAMWK